MHWISFTITWKPKESYNDVVYQALYIIWKTFKMPATYPNIATSVKG